MSSSAGRPNPAATVGVRRLSGRDLINYRDVSEFKAQGKDMSTTSKVLMGTGIAVGVLVVVGALLVRDFRRNFGR